MKLYYLVVLFSAVFLTVCYSSKILAMKAVPLKSVPFTNIVELAEQDTYIPILEDGTSIIQTIMASDDYEFVALRKKIQQDYQKYVMDLSTSTIERRLKNENIAFISTAEYLYYFKKRNTNLQIMEDRFLRSGVHFAWRKEFPLGRIMNTVLWTMRENGQIKRLRDKYFYVAEKISKQSSPREIQLRAITVPLIIVGCIIVIALLVVFVEKRFAKKEQRILFSRKHST
ncbi:Uncharacterised protein r2_g1426 [Pycnogonum litorale]